MILPVRSGDHPRRPEGDSDLGLTDEIWDMMKVCWKRRDRRWKISRIASTLECHSAAATAETEEHYPPGYGSDEALIRPAHEAGRMGRYPRRPRWLFGVLSHK